MHIFQKPDLGFYLVARDSKNTMVGCLLVLDTDFHSCFKRQKLWSPNYL